MDLRADPDDLRCTKRMLPKSARGARQQTHSRAVGRRRNLLRSQDEAIADHPAQAMKPGELQSRA